MSETNVGTKYLVFVYGTLKKGWGNHVIIEDQKFLGASKTLDERFQMYHLGGYPGVVAGSASVPGELYEVDEAAFARCDRLEGHPHFYKRELVTVSDPDGDEGDCLEAWMYVYQGSVRQDRPIDEWLNYGF